MKPRLFIGYLLISFFTILIFKLNHYIIYNKEYNIYNFPKGHENKNIKFKTSPSFLAHIGSLHLSPKTYKLVQIIFNNLTQIIKPCATIITGSITNGISEDGWSNFSQIIRSSSYDKIQTPIIASAGKEDHYFYNEPSKYYNDFFNISKFTAFSYNHSNDDKKIIDNIKITIFNPLTFPYPPHPMSTFSKPNLSIIQKLDEEINLNFNSNFISLIMSSYPINSIINPSGEFLSAISKSRIYLTENSYSSEFQTHIFNQTYEFAASPLSKQSKIGILTEDNSILSYNTIDFDEDYLFVLSNPSYFYQVGTSFRIRLIVFEIHNLTLVVYIDKIYRGRLKPDLISENYIVYGMDVKLTEGKHNLFIDGDVSIKRDFFVGKGNYTADPSFVLRNKYIYDIFNFGLFVITFVIIIVFNNYNYWIFFIYLLMIVSPVYFTWKNSQMFFVWIWGFVSNLNSCFGSIHSNTFSIIESIMIVNSLLLLSRNDSVNKRFFNLILNESPLIIGFVICFLLIYTYGGLKSLVTSPLIVIFLLTQIFVIRLYYKLNKID